MDKALTIVIPAYNMQDYLERCLDSMITEKAKELLEVLIVDDGSKDNTAEIGLKYEKKYPSIFKLIKKENGGHGSAINVGIEKATGKYLRPIDADDWVDSNALDYCLERMKNVNVDMILTNFKKVLEKSNKTVNVRLKNVFNLKQIQNGEAHTTEGRELYIYDNVYDFNNDLYDYAPQYLFHFTTYRTELLRSNNVRLTEHVFYDDMEYDIYPLIYVKSVLPIDRYLYMYRLERDGQSVDESSFIKNRKHRETIVRNLFAYMKEHKTQFGKKVYNYLLPDMLWKVRRQYEIYMAMPDQKAALGELKAFDKKVKAANPELFGMEKDELVLKLRKNYSSYPSVRKRYLERVVRQKNAASLPKAWTIESDLEMHKLIKHRRIFKALHLTKLDPEMQKIRALKNSRKGESCFITCTGPSLTISDLELLKDRQTIGVNSIVKAYSQTDWRPTYYVLVDIFAFGKFLSENDVPGGIYATDKSFLHYRSRPKNVNGSEVYCLISYENHRHDWMKKKKIKVSDDLSVCAYDCFTVTNMAIQVAIYLGYKNIYIIGADCDYSGSKIHFVELDDDKQKISEGWLPDALALSIDGYKAVKKFAKRHGVNIYNSTRGGKLEVFKRVPLEEAIKRTAKEK